MSHFLGESTVRIARGPRISAQDSRKRPALAGAFQPTVASGASFHPCAARFPSADARSSRVVFPSPPRRCDPPCAVARKAAAGSGVATVPNVDASSVFRWRYPGRRLGSHDRRQGRQEPSAAPRGGSPCLRWRSRAGRTLIFLAPRLPSGAGLWSGRPRVTYFRFLRPLLLVRHAGARQVRALRPGASSASVTRTRHSAPGTHTLAPASCLRFLGAPTHTPGSTAETRSANRRTSSRPRGSVHSVRLSLATFVSPGESTGPVKFVTESDQVGLGRDEGATVVDCQLWLPLAQHEPQ